MDRSSPWLLLIVVQVLSWRCAVSVVPAITRLDVQCATTGMTVNVDFDNPFNGIIYSKGHFSNPECRYVAASRGQTSYTFTLPMASCGTVKSQAETVVFTNTIVFQNDPAVQEIWDSARKISCDWTTRFDKFVTFHPYTVDMLQVTEVAFSGDSVDCWMDLQRGQGPFAEPVTGVVKIGETLTVVIYARDAEGLFDIAVKDCYAYDNPNYNAPGSRSIQLTDQDGCPLKEKLLPSFFRTRETRNSGASVIAYAFVNAFRFPDTSEVYLACNVEICKGSCANRCQPDKTGSESIGQSRTDTPRPRPINEVTEPVKIITQAPITRLVTRPIVTSAPIPIPVQPKSPDLLISPPFQPKSPDLLIPPPLQPIDVQYIPIAPPPPPPPFRQDRINFPVTRTTPKPVTEIPSGRVNFAPVRGPTRRPPERENLAVPRGSPRNPDEPRPHKANAFHAFHNQVGMFRTRIGGRRRREAVPEGHHNATVHFLKSFVVLAPEDMPDFGRVRQQEGVCFSTANFASGLSIMIVVTVTSAVVALYFCKRARANGKSVDVYSK